MAAASTFSYAQAAKGQSTSASITSPKLPSQPQSQSTPAAAGGSNSEDAIESSHGTRASEPRAAEPRAHVGLEKQDVDSTVGSESDIRSETTHERRPESRRDDDSGRLDRPWRRAEKGTRSSSTATRSVDEQESRKSRKGKKPKAVPEKSQTSDPASEMDKAQEEVQEMPKKELSEAPIPVVNVWHQRKELQSKANPSPSEPVLNGTTPDAETKKPVKETTLIASTPANKETNVSNGIKPNRKASDPGRSDRNGSKGSRVLDKDGKTDVPPSVDDAASWPTPKTAVQEEHKKQPAVTGEPVASQEKETHDDTSLSKRQKEKWVTYDFVPTVSFETQLPQIRKQSRGGARNAHNSRSTPTSVPLSEKNAVSSTQTVTSRNESKERAKEGSPGPNRTNSQPPAFKRASMDASGAPKEQKRGTAHGGNERVNIDRGKEAATTQATQQHSNGSFNHATRSEGRPERGRGGFRGRGLHHAPNGHPHQLNGFNYNNGSGVGRPQGPYSPPPRQGPHGQGFTPSSQRGGRGRGAAGNNYHRMSLPNGTTRLPPIQASFSPYEYPMHPMSAVPFSSPPQIWDTTAFDLLKSQIEYYFSIENLCKDVFLRRHMDSQGFVNLHFIAAFRRMRDLTKNSSSPMSAIRHACDVSNKVELVVGDDENEYVRRLDDWQHWILDMESRDPLARNDGPSRLSFETQSLSSVNPFNEAAAPMAYGVAFPMAYSPQGSNHYAHFPDGMGAGQVPNGLVNGHGSTQLSADVPDFSPSGSNATARQAFEGPANYSPGTVNGNPLANGTHGE